MALSKLLTADTAPCVDVLPSERVRAGHAKGSPGVQITEQLPDKPAGIGHTHFALSHFDANGIAKLPFKSFVRCHTEAAPLGLVLD